MVRGEVEAFVEEAHRLGRRTAAHGEGMTGSEPAALLDLDRVRLVLRGGTWWAAPTSRRTRRAAETRSGILDAVRGRSRVARSVRLGRVVGALVIGLGLAGCSVVETRTVGAGTATGSSTGSVPSSVAGRTPSAGWERGLVPRGYTGRFRVGATVLQNGAGDAGRPALCSAVATSLPPQCAGPPIEGWDWDAIPRESQERTSGVRWGEFVLVGRFDGTVFTLTEPAAPAGSRSGPAVPSDPGDRFDTPCVEPSGGWVVLDRSRAGQRDLDRAVSAARALPGFAGVWIDHRGSPPAVEAGRESDVSGVVLTVAVVGDEATAEQRVREVWSGSLCITRAARAYPDLQRVQTEVVEELEGQGLISASLDETAARVEVVVRVATVEEQSRLDERYGAGVVQLSGAFWPLDR